MGHTAPGAVLSQVTLAQELGISRTPLREALNRLTTEGLFTSDFNRRMRVSSLDLDDFDQIYAARLALEPVGVMATVGRLDEAARTELAAHVSEMDAAIEINDMEAFRLAHRAFHLGLTSGAGARISRMLADLWDHSERYRLTYLHYDESRPGQTLDERLRLSQTEHRQLLETAVAGDSSDCATILTAHLTRTLEAVFREMVPAPHRRVAHLALDYGASHSRGTGNI